MSEEAVSNVTESCEKMFTQDHATQVCYIKSSIDPVCRQAQMPMLATKKLSTWDHGKRVNRRS